LEKTALLPVDSSNFELFIRYAGTDTYTPLSLGYVSFSDDGKTMTWDEYGDGDITAETLPLEKGDVVVVVYKVASVVNQSAENYIRGLPLADKRDELEVTNPKKNWNVRLLERDDPMFATLVTKTHPFRYPVTWGKVRTEFAYSENVYNMEEYNGSFRDSNLPCDIDKSFVDSCSECLGSVISVDVEIEDLTNDRIAEALEVVKDYVPFHAQIDSVNYSGAVNEFVPTPTEELEVLVWFNLNENVFVGQGDFTRRIPNLFDTTGQLRRDMMSTESTAVAATTGTAYNDEIVLFSPDYRFNDLDADYIDTDPTTQNLLEILDGPNAGSYNVEDPGTNTIKIIQGTPDTILSPNDTSAFTFNLSNQIVSDLSATVTQDDTYKFSESGQKLSELNLPTEEDSSSPAKLVIVSGSYAGTYTIKELLPDDSIMVSGFPSTSNVSDLKYKITNSTGSVTYLNRSVGGAGRVVVSRRGKVTTVNLTEDWGVKIGYYIRYNGTDYQITGFGSATEAYIADYTAGTVAGVPVKVYKRLVNNGTGYLDLRGMYLLTAMDYEAALDVQNGSNPPAVAVENSSFVENFLVVVHGSSDAYYQITAWDGNRIDLSGPKESWGLSGTSVNYSIMQYTTFPVSFADQDFQRIDRRGGEPVTTETEDLSMFQTLRAIAMNSGNGGDIIEQVTTEESISFQVEWADGSITEGQI
jgi:hypothetical protein